MPDIQPTDISINNPEPVKAPFVPSIANPETYTDPSKVLSGADLFGALASQYKPKSLNTPIAVSQQDTKRYESFNPYLNNEQVYAENQSGLSKWGNALAKTAITTVGTFAEGLMSIPDQMRGLTGTAGANVYKNSWAQAIDEYRNNAEDKFPNYYTQWEKDHPFLSAIPFTGGGANFWSDKILKNTGFTLGAIGSAALQDVVIGAATEGLGDIPLISNQLGKASLYLNKIFTGADKAHDFVEIAKPLVTATDDLASTANKLALAAQKVKILDGARFGTATYLSSHTEASIEARDGYNKVKQDLIGQYTSENGTAPVGDDLTKIEQYATAAGNTRYGINMALLTVSNALQFESILKPFSSTKRILQKGVGSDLAEQAGTKIGVKAGKIELASDIDNLVTKVPTSIGGKVLNNFKPVLTNIFAEGVYEEGGQFAAEKATSKYFEDKYNGKIKGNVDDIINSVGYGLSEQFGTTEGLENIFLGSITGALFAPISNKIGNIKGKRAGILSEKEATQVSLNRLKDFSVTGFLQDSYDNTANSIKRKEDIETAVKNNDVFAFKNLQSQEFFDFITSGIKAGRFDVRTAQLEMLKELPKEEFNKTFGIQDNEREDTIKYIDNLIGKATQIKTSHDAISAIFPNPFPYRGAAKTDEQKRINEQYIAFEDYKAALSQFTYNSQDFNSRLSQINNDITKINPLLSSTLVSNLSNPEYLRELVTDYTTQASQLEKSITEGSLKGQERIDTREKIKELNTLLKNLKEFNNSAHTDPAKHIKLFTDLANFEIADPNNPVLQEQASQLVTYGHDVNRINTGKLWAKEAYNHLFTQEGYEDFMKNYDEWRNSLSLGNKTEQPAKDKVEEIPQEDIIKTDSGDFARNRNYVLEDKEAPKYTVKKATDSDTYNILSPGGDIIDSSASKEEADSIKDQENDNLNKLNNVKVVGLTDKGLLEIEDADGKVQYVEPELLKNHTIKYSEEEIVNQRKAFYDKIDAEIKALNTKPADYITPSNEEVSNISLFEDPKKSLNILYSSSTFDPNEIKSYSQRSQYFLNNLDKLSDDKKKNLKLILVTPNNQSKVGINNLSDVLLAGTQIPKDNFEQSPITVVVVRQDDNGIFNFIDADGNAIGKLGENIDANNLIFQLMPTADISYRSNNEARYRIQDEGKVLPYAESWKNRRKDLFAQTDTFEVYDFAVSNGIPNITNKIDGEYERNSIIDTIIPRNQLSKQGLITVVTGPVLLNGEEIKSIPVGTLSIQTPTSTRLLLDRKLTTREIDNISDVFKVFAEKANKTQKFDREIVDYLSAITFFSKPNEGKNTIQKQIFIEKGFLNIGETKIPFTNKGIIDSEASIKSALGKVYLNANNKLLQDNQSFKEIISVDEEGNFKYRTWKSYQHFLVSDKYDIEETADEFKDKTRKVEDIPFTTNIRKSLGKIENNGITQYDNNVKGRYMMLTSNIEGKPLFEVQTKKEVVEAPKAAEENIIVDAGTVQTNDIQAVFTTKSNENISYTLSADNKIKVIQDEEYEKAKARLLQNPAIQNILTNNEGLPEDEVINTNLNNLIRKSLQNKVQEVTEVKNEQKVEEKAKEIITEKKEAKKRKGSLSYGEEQYSRIISSQYKIQNIEKDEKWFKDNLSISVSRVNHLINTTDGGYAFGVFYKNAAQVYIGAQEGTYQHEGFEAVYAMYLTTKEKSDIINEFNNRDGSFISAETGKTISYKDATEQEAKEQIADELGEYVRDGKISYEPIKGKNFIYRFINSLANLLKKLFTGKVTQEQIFNRINTGYYKNFAILNDGYSNIAQYRKIANLSETDSYNVIRGITISIIQELLKDNKSLVEFDTQGFKVTNLFNKAKDKLNTFFTSDEYDDAVPALLEDGKITQQQYENYTKLWESIDADWNNAVLYTKEYLKTFGIVADVTNDTIENVIDGEISENDKESMETDYDGGKSADSYVLDFFKIDLSKNASASIKLLLATIPESRFKDQSKTDTISILEEGTQMQQMVVYAKTFNFLLEQLHNVNTMEEKEAKLKEIASIYPNYFNIIKRLKLNKPVDTLTSDDWNLRAKFFNVMSKQRPEAYVEQQDLQKNIIVSDNINVVSNRLINGWISGLKRDAGSANSPIVVNGKEEYVFVGSKLDKYKVSDAIQQLEFLSKGLGIEFTQQMYNNLSTDDKNAVSKAVVSLKNSLSKVAQVIDISANSLGSTGNFQTIAKLYLKANNEGVSTFSNIQGERQQVNIQNNTISNIVNDINNSTSLKDLTNRVSVYDQAYRADSQYLNKVLFLDGEKTSKKLSIGLNQGKRDLANDKEIPIGKMTYPQRLLAEINQNLEKNYYVLVPADSKTEWLLSMEHIIPYKNFFNGDIDDSIYNIFNKYYKTERQLAQGNAKYKSLTQDINGDYVSEELDKDKLQSFINDRVSSLQEVLKKNSIIRATKEDNVFEIKGFNSDFINSEKVHAKKMSQEDLDTLFKFTEVNYIINNIEMHKLFFGDPNSIKDPTKRYKSFLSPRETSIYNSPSFNNALNQDLNKAGTDKIVLEESDYGYWNHKDHMNTTTIQDVESYEVSIADDKNIDKSIRDTFKNVNGTDAQSWAFLPAYREVLWKSGGRFNKQQEALFQYLTAQDRLLLAEDSLYNYTNQALRNSDQNTVDSYERSNNKATLSVLKPIGSGFTTNGNTFLDKTSLAPLSYSLVRGTNLAPHYVKMWKQGLSYMIVNSGRKIGNPGTNNFYNEDGTNNTNDFANVVQIPFRYYGIQVETAGSHDHNTLGTQSSKLITVNLRNNGIPIDYNEEIKGISWNELSEQQKLEQSNIYKAIQRNNNALEELQNEGYKQLLDRFNITDSGDRFYIEDKSKVAKLLQDELFRREAPQNLKEALSLTDDKKEFKVPFEAIANYKQIKDILYSYVDKYIAKLKINGGPKIQISGSGFEVGNRLVKSVKIEGKNKSILVSAGLKFYEAQYDENGNRTSVNRMEVMLPMWFVDKIRNHPKWKGKTNEEILFTLNNTEEGEKILSGIGFRIPTQELNSIEAFTVKAFLPNWVGDSIVVPEAITTKAGSDFDVDKLNTYLKNIYIDAKGSINTIPFYGYGEAAKKQLSKVLLGDFILSNKKVKADLNAIDNLDENAIDEDSFDSIDKLYKQSLENEYIESMEELLLLPANYERLIKPNSADEFKAIRAELVEAAPEEFSTSATNSLLSREYMSYTRHLFLVGKGGVGIAASSQTNNALNQGTRVVIDPTRFNNVAHEFALNKKGEFEGIKIKHNQELIDGTSYSTISNNKDVDGKYISDKISRYIDGFVDIAKDPWISQIIQDPSLTSIFLLLEKLGVSDRQVAFFMNQPIIREFMKNLALNNTTWFYNTNEIKFVRNQFKPSAKTLSAKEVASAESLKNTIGKYYTGKNLTEEELAQQQLVLTEFLKYAVISSELFDLQRATSYDTDSAPDPYAQYKKQNLTQKVEEFGIFTSVDDLLNSSFLGNTSKVIPQASKAISQSLLSLSKDDNISSLLFEVVGQLPERMSKDKYKKVTRALEESFISYLLQTQRGLNGKLNELLVDAETNVAKQLQKVKKQIPKDSTLGRNMILQQLLPIIRNKNTNVKNLMLAQKPNDAFTSDVYTGALRELRDNPLTSTLYGNILRLGFLQSGITNSLISYMQFIPSEDYSTVIKPLVDKVSTYDNLREFVDLGAFFRNSVQNEDVVPKIKEKWNEEKDEQGQVMIGSYKSAQRVSPEEAIQLRWFYALKKEKGITDASYRPYKISTKNRLAKSKYISIDLTEEPSDNTSAPVRQGTVLLRRVDDYNGDTKLIRHPNAAWVKYAVYLPINAWGDGFRAQEYYSTLQPSILATDIRKVNNEISEGDIIDAMLGISRQSEELDNVEESLENIENSTNIATQEDIIEDKINSLVERGIIKKDCN